jgi:spoIIIJ-associated protein
MEWVETTGKTVEEAVDAALDQLGVAEDDAEVEVLEEPKPGLFGRMRGEARVRVRVRPTQPRPKDDRRDRRRRSRPDGNGNGAEAETSAPVAATTAPADDADDAGADEELARPSRTRPGRSGESMSEVEEDEEEVSLEAQAAEATDFLKGLIERLGLDASISSENLSDDAVEVRVTGEDLGILIGPRGNTLVSVQDLARTVVQRRLNAHHGRLMVDVSGYRQKRKAALERFTRDLAEQVKSSGQRKVLEPMSAPDRKVVHDTANEIDGVTTASEGEEPRRRVVILPQG